MKLIDIMKEFSWLSLFIYMIGKIEWNEIQIFFKGIDPP